jgi:uncharacterized RDD family membrane protein YckC
MSSDTIALLFKQLVRIFICKSGHRNEGLKMKCENCGNLLVGAAIICRVCNHNNAMQRVSEWRTKHSAASRASAARRTSSIKNEQETDASLIQFPAQSPVEAESGLSEYPPWREELKEKVRQARERRIGQSTAAGSLPDEADLDPNPIVAAALKRIRRSSTAPAVTPPVRTRRYGAQTAAIAEVIEDEQEPRPELPSRERRSLITPLAERKTEVSAAPRPATGRTATKTITPITEPVVKARPEPKIQPTAAPKPLPPLAKSKPVVEEPKPEPAREEIKTEPPPAINPAPPIKPSRSFTETQIVGIPYIVVSDNPAASVNSASLWVRTLAGACDFEVISMAYLPIFAAYATLNTSLGDEAFFILAVLLAAITFLYQAVTLHISDRTFGMALLNMRLVNTGDETLPLTRRQKLLRAWAATIAFLLPPLNLIVMHLNKNRLSLPDLISGAAPIED